MADSEFPAHLLLLILIRLPVKSLLRFRCVSKSWNLLISTQDFAKMHLNHSDCHPKPLGLIWNNESTVKEHIERMNIFAVDCSKLEDSGDTIHRLHHPLECPDWIEPTLIGSCNGLLCVIQPCPHGYECQESFLVFNPLIRKGSTFYGETCWCRLGRSDYYGFGYDDVHDDYKVVTWGVRPEQFMADADCSKFDVYSVKDGSWSTKISGLTGYYQDGISPGVLVNCILHWIWKNSEHRYKIVAFDLRTEEHRLMETPENDLAIPKLDKLRGKYRCGMELGALNGCLCGIVFHSEVPIKLDLWVMKEYGINDSWIKMTLDMSLEVRFTGGLNTKLGNVTPIVPIVHLEDKKQMILFSYDEGFLLCDMVSKKLSKVIKIPKFHPDYHNFPINHSFVPKEFCFQGSIVQLPCFRRFNSLWDE